MPTRADLEAAVPVCDRLHGPLSERAMCGRPMIWHAPSERWVCLRHGFVMSGQEAAERLQTAMRPAA